MRYVDGYLLPVPKKNLKAYQKIAHKAGTIWKKYGALEYMECAGDDLKSDWSTITFPTTVKCKPGEKVIVPPPKTEADVRERAGHKEYERFDFYLNKKSL